MVILGSQPLNTGDYRHIQHLNHGDFRIAIVKIGDYRYIQCLNYGDSGIATVKIGDYRHIQCLNYGDFGIAHCLRLVIIGTLKSLTMVFLGSLTT